MRTDSLCGFLGFLLFALTFLILFPSDFVAEKLGFSVNMIEFLDKIELLFMVIGVIFLWVGIITTMKSKGYDRVYGYLLCLIAPLGWLIALFLRSKQSTQESNKAVQSRRLLWINLIILCISLAFSFFVVRHGQITSEELWDLKTTYRQIVQMGGHIGQSNTFYEFIALTGRHKGSRLQVAGENYGRNTYDTDWDTRSVSFNGTGISNEDLVLANLKVLKHLRILNLNDTKISDEGLIYLYDLKALRFLYLTNTMVTAGGIENLKKVLPHCRIKKE